VPTGWEETVVKQAAVDAKGSDVEMKMLLPAMPSSYALALLTAPAPASTAQPQPGHRWAQWGPGPSCAADAGMETGRRGMSA